MPWESRTSSHNRTSLRCRRTDPPVLKDKMVASRASAGLPLPDSPSEMVSHGPVTEICAHARLVDCGRRCPMTHGDSLFLTVEATQRFLEERLEAALVAHRGPGLAREGYCRTDAFLAATSRHLAAVEAVLVPTLLRTRPQADGPARGDPRAAPRPERAVASLKA